MPTWGKPSKVLSTQSDRQMKAPPRMYRQKHGIDDVPEPTRYNRPFTPAEKTQIRETIKRKSMQGMRELAAPAASAKAKSRYSEKAVSR